MKKIAGCGIGAALLFTLSIILSSPIFGFQSLPLSNFLNLLAILMLVIGIYFFVKMTILDVREMMRLKEEKEKSASKKVT